MRKAGIVITEYRARCEIGVTTERIENGRRVQFIKTADGWKRIKKGKASVPKEKAAPKPKPINVKTKPASTKAPTDKRKPDYEKQGPVKIKKDDLTTHYYKKRDNRTHVLTPRSN